MWKSLFALLAALATIMIEIPVNKVKSNIASWLDLLGIQAKWTDIEGIDNLLRYPVYGFIALGLILFFFRKKKIIPTEQNTSPKTIIDNSVKSKNQKGGITAHTVNLEKQDRPLSNELKKSLLSALKAEKSTHLSIYCIANDPEAENFARKIITLLKSHDYIISSFTASSMTGGDGSIVISKDNEGLFIMIGENIRTDRTLQFISGFSAGLGV